MFTQVQRRHQENVALHGGGNEKLNFDGVEVTPEKLHCDCRAAVAYARATGPPKCKATRVAVDFSEHAYAALGPVWWNPSSSGDAGTGATLFDQETHHVGHEARGRRLLAVLFLSLTYLLAERFLEKNLGAGITTWWSSGWCAEGFRVSRRASADWVQAMHRKRTRGGQ